LKAVQIKTGYDQLLEMAAAFGARLLGAGLAVNFDSAAMIREGGYSGPSSRKSVAPEMTTKAAPSSRAPKTSSTWQGFSYITI
jgi:hypothetical protein